ncbi:hypothetical protein FKP32DRAFT_1679406 [Trametes sanguinea]|nr:hypothetical protein FKP32DRAFT_1679406 [Trametes sanguinea]
MDHHIPEHPAPAYDPGFDGHHHQHFQPPPQMPEPPQPQAQAQAANMFVGMTADQLQALIANIVGNLPQPPPPAAAPVSDPRARIRVKEPDAFTGDRTLYRTWKSQMERYLAAYPQASEHEQITVLMSFIRGSSIDEWVNAYADKHFDRTHHVWTRSLADVWHDLDLAYTDRIAEHTALQRMKELCRSRMGKGLRQQPGHAAEYFQEFEKLVWMAGVERTDRMVLEYVKDAICDRFRQAIHNRLELPETYEQWKDAVVKLDDNYMREQAIIQSRRGTAPLPRTTQTQRGTTSTATTSNAPATTASTATGARTDGTGVLYGGAGQPMDLDRNRISQCWRCGGRRTQPAPGCPNQWHRPLQQHRAPAPAVPAAQPPAPAAPQRFRGLNQEELTELVRSWATEEPDQFRNAGFGRGPA